MMKPPLKGLGCYMCDDDWPRWVTDNALTNPLHELPDGMHKCHVPDCVVESKLRCARWPHCGCEGDTCGEVA